MPPPGPPTAGLRERAGAPQGNEVTKNLIPWPPYPKEWALLPLHPIVLFLPLSYAEKNPPSPTGTPCTHLPRAWPGASPRSMEISVCDGWSRCPPRQRRLLLGSCLLLRGHCPVHLGSLWGAHQEGDRDTAVTGPSDPLAPGPQDGGPPPAEPLLISPTLPPAPPAHSPSSHRRSCRAPSFLRTHVSKARPRPSRLTQGLLPPRVPTFTDPSPTPNAPTHMQGPCGHRRICSSVGGHPERETFSPTQGGWLDPSHSHRFPHSRPPHSLLLGGGLSFESTHTLLPHAVLTPRT